MRLRFALVCLALAFTAHRVQSADESAPDAFTNTPVDSWIDSLFSSTTPPPAGHFYASKEFILWQIKSSPLPTPLVTSASFADPLPGAVGQAGTHVLLGGSSINTPIQPGLRVMFGYRTDLGVSVETSYLYTNTSSSTTTGTSGLPGSPNLAVPFFDVSGVSGLNGIPGQTVYVLPGPLPGAGGTQVPGFGGEFKLGLSSVFQGAEANAATHFGDWGNLHVDGLAGFRWLELHENLSFSATTHGLPGTTVASAFANTFDQFKTRDDFFGGQIGLRSTYEVGRWSLMATGKVGFGDVHQSVTVAGRSETSSGNLFFQTNGTAGHVLPGGIFAQPSNSGSYSRDVLAVQPEATMNLGYQLTHHFKLIIGYNFLYLGNVVQPGDVIDPNINSTRTSLAGASRATVGTGTGPIPFGTPGAAPAASGPSGPNFRFSASDFWVQGLNIGVAGRY